MSVEAQTQGQRKYPTGTFPLNGSQDLDPLMDRIGDARFVLLGEASHGTHEYYTWRTRLSKRLIEEKGFSFIAVEADWPDCYQINQFIKDDPGPPANSTQVLKKFVRWPTWMWANWEISALTDWLRRYNDGRSPEKKVGFYGLDVYSLWDSLERLLDYLQKEDPDAARLVKKAIQCFEPYGEEGFGYAQASQLIPEPCRTEVRKLLNEIRRKAPTYNHDREAPLNTEINAMVAVNAERYYESMTSFGPESWNIRDTHMADTLQRLMNFHGPQAKAIVWEHNTHIGDARYTDMKKEGMVNLGQLVRQQHAAQEVVLVGFGSYQGTVIAGQEWGAPMEVMTVPPARPGSVEAILHQEGARNQLLIFDPNDPKDHFREVLPHRAIGVVYRPEREKFGNYVPTVLNGRYDAFMYLDRTQALFPLHLHPDQNPIPDTFPFGA
jgi:erythromycin esterase-like protein